MFFYSSILFGITLIYCQFVGRDYGVGVINSKSQINPSSVVSMNLSSVKLTHSLLIAANLDFSAFNQLQKLNLSNNKLTDGI